MRPIDEVVCEITCPACRRAAAVVSPNTDGTYTIEDYRRGVDPWKTDPARRWETIATLPDLASLAALVTGIVGAASRLDRIGDP